MSNNNKRSLIFNGEIGFATLADAFSDAVLAIDDKEKIIFSNAGASRITGYSAKELTTLHIKNLMTIGDYRKIKRLVGQRDVKNKKLLEKHEVSLLKKNGQNVFVEISPTRTSCDGQLYHLCVMHDMTDREKAEELLRNAKNKAEKYLNIAGVIILALDVSGKITLLNKKGYELLGHKEGTLIGKNWFKTYLPSNDPCAKTELEKTKNVFKNIISGVDSEENEYEGIIRTVNREQKFINWHNAPLKNSKGEIIGMLSSGEDITELKELDKIKTEFISVASHQLKTPVAAINWYTESLLNREVGDINDKQKKYLGEVYKNGNRMVALVNDLLNVSRINAKNIKVAPIDIDLGGLILEIINDLDPLLKSKSGKIIFKNTIGKMLKMPLDKSLISHIVRNLLANSIRYLKVGYEGKIEVKITNDKRGYIISFKDNGIGIPAKDQPKIFDKFFRADNAIKTMSDGTGLGLYIVKMITSLFGSEVWFKSKKDVGSTFFLLIPKAGMEKREGTHSFG